MSKDYSTTVISDAVLQMMTDIVLVLNSYGITQIPASNVMRLLGTPEDEASLWEHIMLTVDEDGKVSCLIDTDDKPHIINTPTQLYKFLKRYDGK